MGGPAMLRRLAVTPEAALREAGERAAERGRAVVYLIEAGRVLAAFAVADAVRPESREAVQRLHDQRIEVVMLTGDARAVAHAVAAELGIDTALRKCCPRTRSTRSNN
jgi:Cu2+-exporting ATPase